MPVPRKLVVFDLGRVEYDDGLALQRAFAASRRGRAISDALLIVEHPPVITLGRGGRPEHLKKPREALEAQGVQVFHADRGGDVTYHGPGQVVGYPIVDLVPDRKDVRRYVRDVEEAMIRTVDAFGLSSHRIDGWPGVWLGERGKDARKLGAVGVHISRWITTHGFALNVNTDLAAFDLIVPCGISDASVTSLEKELGAAQSVARAKELVAARLAECLGAELAVGRPDKATVSVTVVRKRPEGLEVLLLRRHERRGGFWQPVTGSLEQGETPADCARRELGEETGLADLVRPLDYVHAFAFGLPRAHRPPRVFEETAFWCATEGGAEIRLDESEHAEHVWLPAAEALTRVPFAGLKESVRRALHAAARDAAGPGVSALA